MTLAQRIALWLDPNPARVSLELLELSVKAARRCAHDLEHCAGDIWYASQRPEIATEQSKMWHERAKHWQVIFYPENGIKDYHAKLAIRVDNAEETIEKLRAHCLKHGIPQWLDHECPF